MKNLARCKILKTGTWPRRKLERGRLNRLSKKTMRKGVRSLSKSNPSSNTQTRRKGSDQKKDEVSKKRGKGGPEESGEKEGPTIGSPKPQELSAQHSV